MPLYNVAVNVYLVIILWFIIDLFYYNIIISNYFFQLTLHMIEIQIQINNFGKGT